MWRPFSLSDFRLVLAAIFFLFAAGCSKKSSVQTAQAPVAEKQKSESASLPLTDSSDLPRAGGPPGYAGSKSCRPCHEDQYASWHKSYHRTMTQIASPETVRADFHNVVLTNDATRLTLSEKAGEFWVQMEHISPGNESSDAVHARMGLVTGSHHMQVFWVPTGEGNTQVGFPFTWLIPEARWAPRNSTFIRPPDGPHKSEIWNVVCSRCHATGIEPRVQVGSRAADTRAGELGIACEACHGPGQHHLEARLAAATKSIPVAAQLPRAEIVHPKKIDPVRASQVCGFCHSMKWMDRGENWRLNGFRYRPGADLEATTPIIRPSRVKDIPGLSEYLDRNPDLFRDFFWPDGMIRVSGREYNGLIESPCYKGNKFSCLSCHSLHESDPAGQLAQKAKGKEACAQCHERFRDEGQVSAHTHHAPGSSGSECYNCHMPYTTYGVLKAIRSHQVSSPRVIDELSTGRPNACNLCHLDKPLNWTADLLEGWYRQPKPALPEDERDLSHAARLALSGDAGQRVLAAWHLGWSPALRASGTNWVAPILGQLLDDPYAAVRCVAERSLKANSNLVPPGYDYAIDPNSRPSAREAVWLSWQRQYGGVGIAGVIARQVMIGPGDAEAQWTVFDKWLQKRDDRPVRLRE